MLNTYHKLCMFILKKLPENGDGDIGRKQSKAKQTERARTIEMVLGSVVRHFVKYRHSQPIAMKEEVKRIGEGETTKETYKCRINEICNHAKILNSLKTWKGLLKNRLISCLILLRKRKKNILLTCLTK